MADASSGFDWRVYADATCAGLAVLIPIPFLDLVFEHAFLGRMPRAVFSARQVKATEEEIAVLRRNDKPVFSAKSCLTVPLAVVLYALKRISRKILYFLTIREAAEKLSLHWHRAFLLDHIATGGYLQDGGSVEQAKTSLEETIDIADTSPLMHLARSTVRSAGRVFRLLVRSRRRGPGQGVKEREKQLEGAWADLSGHFDEVAETFDQLYREKGSNG